MIDALWVAVSVSGSASKGGGKPWFSRRIDPGSSTGGAGGDDTAAKVGGLGRGLCIPADWGHAAALRAGERSMSLTAASKSAAEWGAWAAAF
jgi:hypothetical protein